MLLQPRYFISKKRLKKRKLNKFDIKYGLKFGDFGLLLLQPLQLTALHISKLKLFVKKAARKQDKTRRLIWFNAFPHLPLTRKSLGLRMGKGKGKLECWFTQLRGGFVLLELKNVRFGRARFFLKQLTFKLGIKTKILTLNRIWLNSPLDSSSKFFLKSFW